MSQNFGLTSLYKELPCILDYSLRSPSFVCIYNPINHVMRACNLNMAYEIWWLIISKPGNLDGVFQLISMISVSTSCLLNSDININKMRGIKHLFLYSSCIITYNAVKEKRTGQCLQKISVKQLFSQLSASQTYNRMLRDPV